MSGANAKTGQDRRLELIGLAAVLALGLVLRIRHLDTLLPWFVYVDEARTAEVTLGLFHRGSLDPRFSLYPAFGFYVNGLFYLAWALAGSVSAVFSEGPSALLGYFQGFSGSDPVLIMLSRWVSIGFGLGSLLLAHLLARQFLNQRFALFSTLLFALNSLHISMSSLAKPDSMNCFFILLGLYLTSLYLREGRRKHLYLSAFVAGVSFSVKYYPVLVIWVFLLSLFGGWRKERGLRGLLTNRDLYFSCFIMAGAAFMATPYTFLRLKDTLIMFGFLYKSGEYMSFFHTDPHVWWLDRHYYIASVVLPVILGLGLFWFSIPGVFHHARKWALKDPSLFLPAVVFIYAYNSQQGGPGGGSMPFYLFLFTVPLLIIMAGDLLQDLCASKEPILRAAGIVFAVSLAAVSLARVDTYRAIFYGQYDRLGPWTLEHIKPGAKTLLLSVYVPTSALAAPARNVWPQDFTEKLLEEYQPDVLVIDSRAVAGFRRHYRDLWVAPLVDSYLSGARGFRIAARFRAEYPERFYFASIDPELDEELIVLAKPGAVKEGTARPAGPENTSQLKRTPPP